MKKQVILLDNEDVVELLSKNIKYCIVDIRLQMLLIEVNSFI